MDLGRPATSYKTISNNFCSLMLLRPEGSEGARGPRGPGRDIWTRQSAKARDLPRWRAGPPIGKEGTRSASLGYGSRPGATGAAPALRKPPLLLREPTEGGSSGWK